LQGSCVRKPESFYTYNKQNWDSYKCDNAQLENEACSIIWKIWRREDNEQSDGVKRGCDNREWPQRCRRNAKPLQVADDELGCSPIVGIGQ
jgi:hypothetical protein